MAVLSVSRMKLFKACPRAYQLKYMEGLEPIEKAAALSTGISYHAKIEGLYRDGAVDTSDLSRESAMATAYTKYIYPQFHVKCVEEWKEYDLRNGDKLVGRLDGIAEDGSIVEHKTTSLPLAEFEYNLQWDEQMLAYMLMTGARHVYYTVCRKPTIRVKKGETEEEFFRRMVEWYDTDTQTKITLLSITRSDADVERFEKETRGFCCVMWLAQSNPDRIYRNTAYCSHWGRQCEYAPVCLGYRRGDPHVGFTCELETERQDTEFF